MRVYTIKSVEQRFWDKFLAEPNSGCWLWMGGVNNKGYGQIGGGGRGGGLVLAHRASWAIHHGAIPDGLWVLHRCDIPCCVNPNHLFLGTVADNMSDMVCKGRGRNQNSGKTHCKHGHPLTGKNLYVIKCRDNITRRRCRVCIAGTKKRYRDRMAGIPAALMEE